MDAGGAEGVCGRQWQNAVDIAREDEVDEVGVTQDLALGEDDHVGVVQPDLARGAAIVGVEQRTFEVDHRGQKPPIVAAAEDHDLAQVRADVPTTGKRDGLHGRGRGFERVAARQADLAKDITESRRALVKHGRDFDAGNRGGVAVIDLDLQLVEREALRQNAADGGERDRSIGRDADLHSLPADDA